jgi:hypothetical protein
MRAATYMAFLDELGKIKEAGMMSNLGTKILTSAKGAGRYLKNETQGGIINAGKAVASWANPVNSFKKGLHTTIHDTKSMSVPMKALMGVGLLSSAHEATAKNDPMGKGRGRAERIGAALGDQVGGVMGAPFGIAGGLVSSQIGRKAGGVVGKGVDLLRRPKPQPTATEI